MKGLFLVALVFVIAGCTKSTIEDFELIEEEFSGGGNYGCGDDIVGQWEAQDVVCTSNFPQKFYLDCNGNGFATNPPCVTSSCQEELKWDFTYTVSGGTCYMTYPATNQYTCCGVDVPPGNQSGASFTYSVSGNTLTTSFGTFTK
ncbi:MAG: hypothetical protein RL679_671 [Bacteroidota bacterium]|jgi:hypothetical protein